MPYTQISNYGSNQLPPSLYFDGEGGTGTGEPGGGSAGGGKRKAPTKTKKAPPKAKKKR